MEVTTGKSEEEQSSQNGMMLRCTGNSTCVNAQMHGQSMEAEVLCYELDGEAEGNKEMGNHSYADWNVAQRLVWRQD